LALYLTHAPEHGAKPGEAEPEEGAETGKKH
jgi:hypothetical protein